MANKLLKRQLRKINQRQKMAKSNSKAIRSSEARIVEIDYDAIALQERDLEYYQDMAQQSDVEHDMGGYSIYY